MAYESLDKHTLFLSSEYEKSNRLEYLLAMVNFHETVLSIPKFKSQRIFCEKEILRVNKHFYSGYFKKPVK